MQADIEMVNCWFDELLDNAIQETEATMSNEHLWELDYEGEDPNPHSQNIANLKRYKDLLQAVKRDAPHFSMLRTRGFPVKFLHGVCGVFALALNDRLDYPIAALHWKDADPDDLWAGLEHFFCVAPGGVYVDVRGTTDDFQAFCMEFSSPKYFRVLKNLDAAQLKRDLMQEMGESNLSILHGEAVAEIKSNLANYKI